MEKNLRNVSEALTFCKVSENNHEDWLHGIIYSINYQKNILKVFLQANVIRTRFQKDNKVLLKFSEDGNEVQIEGVILNKQLSLQKQAITVKIFKKDVFNNNRKHERFKANYAVEIVPSENPSSTAILRDISRGGVQIFSKNSFEESEVVTVNILLASRRILSFSAKILHKVQSEKGFNYGMCIENMDQESTTLLEEILEYLAMQKEQIAHDFRLFKAIRTLVYFASILIVLFIVFVVFSKNAA